MISTICWPLKPVGCLARNGIKGILVGVRGGGASGYIAVVKFGSETLTSVTVGDVIVGDNEGRECLLLVDCKPVVVKSDIKEEEEEEAPVTVTTTATELMQQGKMYYVFGGTSIAAHKSRKQSFVVIENNNFLVKGSEGAYRPSHTFPIPEIELQYIEPVTGNLSLGGNDKTIVTWYGIKIWCGLKQDGSPHSIPLANLEEKVTKAWVSTLISLGAKLRSGLAPNPFGCAKDYRRRKPPMSSASA